MAHLHEQGRGEQESGNHHRPQLPRPHEALELDGTHEDRRRRHSPAHGTRAQEEHGGEGGECDGRGGDAAGDVGEESCVRGPRVTSLVKPR